MAIKVIFTLGNSSDFFLVLCAQNLDSSVLHIALMLILFNITYTLVSTPADILSDIIGRRRLIALGCFIYALVYLGFAMASAICLVWLPFACYGIYYGIVEGVACAFIADLVPAERRGTTYGYFQGAVGLALLPASVISGWLWDAISPSATFYLASVLALITMPGILTLIKEKKASV